MKNIDRSQSRILPLLWAYAEQHLPSLPQAGKFDTHGIFKGHCAGFTETLVAAIRSNQLDTTVNILDKLIVWEEKLLAAQPVPQDNQLDELICTIVSKQNDFNTPAVIDGDFKDSAFTSTCAILKKPGDTAFFYSLSQEIKTQTHIVAVSLMRENPRTYYLIDANGIDPQSLDLKGDSFSMTLITDAAEKIPTFIREKLFLNYSKFTVAIKFLTEDNKILHQPVEKNEFYRDHIASYDDETQEIVQSLQNTGTANNEIPYFKIMEGAGHSIAPDEDFSGFTPPTEVEEEEINFSLLGGFYPDTSAATVPEKQSESTHPFTDSYNLLGLLGLSFYPKKSPTVDAEKDNRVVPH